MAAFKDKNSTWFTSFRYTDWKGERKQKLKRGFPTRREALEWERQFLQQKTADLNMSFEAFVKLYIVDMQNRIREHTWETKHNIIETKVLPYFKDKIISQIKPPDVIAWQNEIMRMRDSKGKLYSATYLKTIHNQLSALIMRYGSMNSKATLPLRLAIWVKKRAQMKCYFGQRTNTSSSQSR